MSEYLRRNLLHAKAVGANANLANLRKRAARVSLPLWLQAGLEGIEIRIRDLPRELAAHRDEIEPTNSSASLEDRAIRFLAPK